MLSLSDGSALTADLVVFASGYRADIGRVPYLDRAARPGVGDRRLPGPQRGLRDVAAGPFVTGFASTRDFGPFYGFTKGCPSAARIAVAEMMR